MNPLEYSLSRWLEVALQNPARLLPWLVGAFAVTLVIAVLNDYSGQAETKTVVIERRKPRP